MESFNKDVFTAVMKSVDIKEEFLSIISDVKVILLQFLDYTFCVKLI